MNNLKSMKTLTIEETTYEMVDAQGRQDIETLKPALTVLLEKEQETDEKYFDIDYDGILSLKPEYRGNPYENYDENSTEIVYPFSISDNDMGNEGSKINELPERIVIPYTVNEIAVTGFQDGMFKHNKRIKELRLPKTVRVIPSDFCYEAFNLEVLENTEHIETIKEHGFAHCAIKKAIFPNLKEEGLGRAFVQDPFLVIADIGNNIEHLPNLFQDCGNLSCVLGGGSITTVAAGAFKGTRRLKNLSFLSQLTSIGNYAFFDSRVNFDDVYATLESNNCSFGENATYKQFNTINNVYNDYWTGVEYTACENPLGSLFHQKNPEWASKNVNDTTYTYGANGCSLMVLAEIYSAFEGIEFSSPEEFAALLKEKGLQDYNFRELDDSQKILSGLGYSAEKIEDMNAENLKKVYDALLDGALVHKTMGTTNNVNGGHIILVYGVNSIGELLIADSDMYSYKVEKYENHKSTMPIYALGSATCNAIIVKKPNTTTDQ